MKLFISFVNFGVPLNHNFGLRTFLGFCGPDSCKQRKNGRNRGKFGWSFKTSGIPRIGGRVAWPSSGRRKWEARPSLLHSLCRGVQRIQPIITFIFSPNFVGLETRAMQQSETPFCFSNLETKQIFAREIGILLDLYWKIRMSGRSVIGNGRIWTIFNLQTWSV